MGKHAHAVFLFMLAGMSSLVSGQTLPFPYIAFGDLRGHFEPCGCNPKTDMGGIERIGGYIDLERSRYKNLEVYSLGNNFHYNTYNTADTFIDKGLRAIVPTASLFGPTEFRNKKAIVDKSFYLLTNSDSIFKKFVETKNSVIFGLTQFKSLKVTDGHMKFIKEKIKSSGKKSILLYAGDVERLTSIMKEISFSKVIAANFSPFSKDPDQMERLDESKLNIKAGSFYIKSVPLGGQGVLMEGISEVKFNNEKDSSTSSGSIWGDTSSTPSFMTNNKTFHWLDRTSVKSDFMSKVVAEYRIASKNSFAVKAEKKYQASKTYESSYIGAAACAGCHASAHKVYMDSSHSSAYETLKEIGQHENDACVGCHVVGYDKKGGFISEKYTPQLKGVGCESCHGPRKEHAANPLNKKLVHPDPKESCVGCHKPPHSVDYQYDTYWPKIRHTLNSPQPK